MPGSPVSWATALVLMAALLLTLVYAWGRSRPSTPLRRAWWLLAVAGCLQALAVPLATAGAVTSSLLGIVVAALVLTAVLRSAPMRRKGTLREQAFEGLLAGALVAFLVWSLPTVTGWRLGLGLVALGAHVGALWLVCLGPRSVRAQARSLRVPLGGSLLLLAGLDTVELVTAWASPSGTVAAALLAVPVGLWAWTLARPGMLGPPPHLARREQGLTPVQIGLVAAGVLTGPVVLALYEWVGILVSVAPLAAGAGILSLLAATHLVLLVTDRGHQAWRAQHDTLTGLPTEPLFEDRLRQAIAGARRAGREVGVAFLDLDGFKAVNDSRGHEAGDQVLCVTARRLAHNLRAQDTVARRSGDEFLMLLPDVAGQEGVELVVERLLAAIAEPLTVDGHEHRVGASIGVALWPRDGLETQELINHADAAMYDAKAAGRGQMRWHRPSTENRARLRLTLGHQLQTALESDELDVAHEPLVNLHDGSVAALVAHARWDHPRLGRLTPPAFLPAAVAAGLSAAVDLRVLSLACRQMARWQRTGGITVPVVVALSDAHVAHEGLEERVLETLERSGLPPHLLTLSVTEDGLRRGGEDLARAVSSFADRGVGVVVRDFGSSDVGIARLSHVRVSAVELSSRLVARATGVELPVVEAVALLADGLGLGMSAAGVDEEEQGELLRSRGCAAARGPALATTVDGHAIEARLAVLARTPGHDPGAVPAVVLAAPVADREIRGSGVAEVLMAALADEEEVSETALMDVLSRAGPAPVERPVVA